MADHLKMDPARIARLRDPARYKQVDPLKILDVVEPAAGAGPVIDVGAGVGFVTLPFARRLADRQIVAADIQAGMLDLLSEQAAADGLENVSTALMPGPTTLPTADGSGAMLVMLQVHHELDDAPGLLAACRRALAPGAPIAIVDWKAEERPGVPQGGRRVPAARIVSDLEDAGFLDVKGHDVYPDHSLTTGRAP